MKKPALTGGMPWTRWPELGFRMSQTQRLGILTAAMILATALIGMITIQGPWQEARRQTGSQLEEENRRSGLLLAIQRQRESLQKTEQETLLEGGAPALTGEVSRLATESQLAIESVIPEPDLAVPPYTPYQIEIVANARLEELLLFLRSIENHRPLLTVNEMEIGVMGETPEPQRVRMRIGALGRPKKPR